MKPYEAAVELHREALDMAVREQIEHRSLNQFVADYGERMVADPSFDNPYVVMMLRMLVEVEPRLAQGGFDSAFMRLFAKEAQTLLDNPSSYAKRMTRYSLSRLAEAETVWASPEIVERALGVSPEDATVPSRQSLPFERAFVMLAEPVEMAGNVLTTVEAVSWDVMTDDRVLVRTFGRVTSDPDAYLYGNEFARGHLIPDMVGLQQFGSQMTMIADTAPDLTVPDTDKHGALTLRIMSLLARVPEDEEAGDVRVAVASAKGDSDAKRAAKKAGIRPEVNVIYVSDEKSRALTGRSGGGSGKVARHRVRAHWRHQAYGPERSLRRWVLVPEHERGNGEVDERDRVYVER